MAIKFTNTPPHLPVEQKSGKAKPTKKEQRPDDSATEVARKAVKAKRSGS